MLETLIPPSTQRLILYPTPVNVRWGPARLRQACESDLGLTLDPTTAVLFHNRKKDTLVLYTLDSNGDRCITKRVDRGTFLLPLPAPEEEYVVLSAAKVKSLFRVGISQGNSATAQKPEASADGIDLSKPLDLVVFAIKERAARCRLPGTEQILTLRATSLHRLVPGQIATVQPSKHWRHKGHPYLSGDIVSVRIDASGLCIPPLALNRFGDWDPAEHYWGEEGDPLDPWTEPIIERGPRPLFEMEQIVPGSNPGDFDSDPILRASELRAVGDHVGARSALQALLEADLRCLDAHAHLGNLEFPDNPHWALAHYEVGVRIGGVALGKDFEGVLAWGLLDNRPFLRCLHGYGLCLWRLERWEAALEVFERMLWMNPSDNQGVRFLLPHVRAGETWRDDEDY